MCPIELWNFLFRNTIFVDKQAGLPLPVCKRKLFLGKFCLKTFCFLGVMASSVSQHLKGKKLKYFHHFP